jgi:hypothetical protein
METGMRTDCGVCAAVDVHYLSTGGARAAAVLAADAVFAHVLAERTTVVPRVAPYRPGEFYLRELPPLRAILDDLGERGGAPGTKAGRDLAYALRACPRAAINSQRSLPAATHEHEASAGSEAATNAREHPRNV